MKNSYNKYDKIISEMYEMIMYEMKDVLKRCVQFLKYLFLDLYDVDNDTVVLVRK